MNALDLLILVAYLGGVTAWGAWLGRGARGGEEYFLGRRDLPWLVVLLSVVATETSTLTFLSIPGIAYGGSLAFIQIAAGYVLGRIAVAAWLLPAYHAGRLNTAYELLEARFGPETRRFTSAIFMVTRLLADSVRLFATAIPLTLVTGWPLVTSIIVIGALTFIYTYIGGIRAIVWVDASQMVLYVAGGLIALVVLGQATPGGWPDILARAAEAGKLTAIDPALDFGRPYTLWAGLLGGAFLSMGSHGADQLIVQRLLACRDLASSRRALVGSGVAVFFQFALFLFVGLGLWAWYDGAAFARSDEIFASFIVEALPAGVRGLLIAAVFAAAMSTLSSSINALSSATVYDFRSRRGAETAAAGPPPPPPPGPPPPPNATSSAPDGLRRWCGRRFSWRRRSGSSPSARRARPSKCRWASPRSCTAGCWARSRSPASPVAPPAPRPGWESRPGSPRSRACGFSRAPPSPGPGSSSSAPSSPCWSASSRGTADPAAALIPRHR